MTVRMRRLLGALFGLALLVGLLSGMSLTALAETEQSETIATTARTVNGTHFTISNGNQWADGSGMSAYSGITVTPKNNEYITSVVITCGWRPEDVSDSSTTVSSGTKTITDGGVTITVTDVNASTFTFTCSHSWPQFKQFVVYYLDSAPTVSVTGVTLDKTSATLTVNGEAVAMTATVSPDDATDRKVKWSVGGTNANAVTLYSDENCQTPVGTDATDVLTVYAKGESAGTATVTVTATNGTDSTDDDKSASCTITVNKPEQTIAAEDVTATYGETGKSVSASVTDPEQGGGELSYAVKSGDAVTVDGSTGELTILKAGSAVVTVTAAETDDYAETTKDVSVTVSAADPTTPTGLTATYGQTLADVALPDDWAWADSTTSVGNVGANTFKANYTAPNANYNSKSDVDVVVTVSEPKKATLTFDLAGGTLDGKTGSVTVVAKVGDTIKLPGAPTRSGYTFQYWKGSQYAAGADYKVEGDHKFTAVWEKKASGNNASTRSGSTSTKGSSTKTGNNSSKATLAKTGDPSSLATVAAMAASGFATLAGGAALGMRTRKRGRHLRG